MTEKITQKEKEKILEEFFSDQAATLRQFKADDMVEKKIAKNFRDAVIIIKKQEEQLIKNPDSFLSEQELSLKEYLNSKEL
ncbi:hypothetical protein HDR60_02160 [bacterium]|nr:hypothetical protein [bacterium]